MTLRRAFSSLACALFLAGCSGGGSDVTAMYFKMFYGGGYDMSPFNAAWTAARQDPALGVAYTFPLLSVGLEEGVTVRLAAGPYTGLRTSDDVVLAEQYDLAESKVGGDGEAAFAPLAVKDDGPWGMNVVPGRLLCGSTQLVARAYRQTDGPPAASQLVAATSFVAVTPACP